MHDVVAHLVGSVADVLAGRVDGIGSPAWTAAQVDARRDASIAEMLAEWHAAAPQFEDTLRTVGGPMAALGVADVWNHEQDLRGALGVAREQRSGRRAHGHRGLRADGRRQPGRPTASRRCGSWPATRPSLSGDGEPGATVTGTPYELARPLAGRRTAAQLRALTWDGDADPYIATLAAWDRSNRSAADPADRAAPTETSVTPPS